MKSEQMPNYWELSSAQQQQNAREFDHHYYKTDPAKLATTLEIAVVSFFISSG